MADESKRPIIVKKIKKGGHAAHGGAWKVAYADFVTAMMAFFLVMWLMSSEEEVQEAVAAYFANPNSSFQVESSRQDKSSFGGSRGPGSHMLKGLEGQLPQEMVPLPMQPFSNNMRDVPEENQDVEDVNKVLTEIPKIKLDSITLTVPERLVFEKGTDKFKSEGTAHLNRLGKLISRHPGKVIIEGFTYPETREISEVPAGADPYQFSITRVVSVMAYFVSQKWIDESRMEPKVSSWNRSPSNIYRIRDEKRVITVRLLSNND